jgi:sporulation integral membrane protein YlbJ
MKYFIIFILIFIFGNFFVIDLKSIILESSNIWLYNLVPSMLPFYVISDLLINYGLIDILAFLFKKIINKLFNVSENASFVIFFSMFTGFPSSAKYLKNLLDLNYISIEDANKIIRFTHFSNPLFIINVIGNTIIGNKKIGFLILLSHYFSNFIIGFLYRKEQTQKITTKRVKNTKSFGSILTTSFINSFDSLLIVLGSLITFKILTSIIFHYFGFNFIISSLLEITQGLFALKDLTLNIELKALIAVAMISFGGFCIHTQVYSILSETKISYKNYFFSRILHIIIATTILTLFFILL